MPGCGSRWGRAGAVVGGVYRTAGSCGRGWRRKDGAPPRAWVDAGPACVPGTAPLLAVFLSIPEEGAAHACCGAALVLDCRSDMVWLRGLLVDVSVMPEQQER